MIRFDVSYYLAQNPDVAAAIDAGQFASAEEHFNLFGFKEGRDPNAFFDTSYYVSQHADVAAAGVNPLDHYNAFGEQEGRNPNPVFDPVYYASQNPDLVEAGVDLLEHYINHGASEGRHPSSAVAQQVENGFDEEAYLAANPDVAAAISTGAFASGYQHWTLFGYEESRTGAQDAEGTPIQITIPGEGPIDPPVGAPNPEEEDGEGGGTPPPSSGFTLELLHIADQEAGAAAVTDAANLSAVLNALRGQDLGNDGIEDNTLTLSSGDAFIPGLFYDASEAVFGSGGIADIQIQNELGIQAIALGNHEFDFGTANLAGLIDGSVTGDFSALVGSTLEGQDFTGTNMPYLSANLDFSTDSNLAPLEVAGGQAPQGNSVSSSTVVEVNGEQIGIVGATTPTLDRISSPGDVGISPTWVESNPTDAELDALAAEIQAEVNQLLSDNPEMNKVILLAHMQQIDIELALAERLEHVDVIVAGGSNTRLFDENDRPRDGDSDQGEYPQFVTNAGGTQTAVVNTDGSYKYVGRLVVDFDEDGNIIADSYDAEVSGAYATDEQGVADLGAEGLEDQEIQDIVDAIEDQIITTESNVFGISDVFLNGNRSGVDTAEDTDGVRTQETNLGNLTADANLAAAQNIDDTVVVSIKNGGGIRASIGQTIVPPGGSEAERTPNEAVFDSDGNLVKPEGGISQNDIQTTLAFNNDLTMLTLTKEELVAVLEHGVSAIPGVSGRFPQISGVKFSYDPDLPAGERILNAGIFDDADNLIAELVRDGEITGNTSQPIRIVTLSFLADGGDGYPFPTGEDTNRVDLTDLDGNGEDDGNRTGDATFADNGTEQDALAEYLADNHATEETGFDEADTGRDEDGRIQNVNYREDDIFDGIAPQMSLVISEIMYNPASGEDDWEWVELANTGSADIDLSGWVFDDINSVAQSGANIASGTITAGETVVLYNADDLSAADFAAAWGEGINLIGVTGWSGAALNNGGDTVGLWSDFDSYSGDNQTHANAVVSVSYDDAGAWPVDDGSASIYLTDLSADANDGSNWALSTVDGETPANTGAQSAAVAGNSGEDVGSTGGTAAVPQALVINEVLGSTAGTDSEYIELFGEPGTSLAGYSIVIVESSNDTIDRQIDFADDAVIGENSYFLLANSTAEDTYGVTADLAISENFIENSSYTVALVETASLSGNTVSGAEVVIDTVAVNDGGEGDSFFFDAPVIGPDGDFLPAGVGRVEDGVDTDTAADWSILDFGNDASVNTPTSGGTNGGGGSGENALISSIQGIGAASSMVGQTVTVSAVVVGDFQNGDDDAERNLGGFFLQEEAADSDGNAATSEGIFVFEGSGNFLTDVNLGDLVTVTGTVNEFFGATQITASSVTIETTSAVADVNSMAATVDLDAASAISDGNGGYVVDLEAYEGMLVTIPETLTVSEAFNFDRFGEVRLSANGRPEQFTQSNAPDATGYDAHLQSVYSDSIVFDDGQTVQNPDSVFASADINGDGVFNTADGFGMGDTITGATGVLGYGFNEYRMHAIEDDANTFVDTQTRDETPPDMNEEGGAGRAPDLVVSSFNVLNFFTTLDNGSNTSGPGGLDPRGAETADEYARQLEKLTTTLTAIDADIFGLVELENEFGTDQNGDGLVAIQAIVDQLNTSYGAGTWDYVDPGRAYVDVSDAISVGMIYKTASVTLDGPAYILDDTAVAGLNGDFGTDALFDGQSTNRAPLAANFSYTYGGPVSGEFTETFTVAVTHMKSKGGSGTGGDADVGDGAGAFNETRTEGVDALIEWLDPTRADAFADEQQIVLGDFNAYAAETPITSMEAANYANLEEEFEPGSTTFVFDGQTGTLDYAFASDALMANVTNAGAWNINSNEPDIYDYNLNLDNDLSDLERDPDIFDGATPYRSSDHDPLLVGLNFSDDIMV